MAAMTSARGAALVDLHTHTVASDGADRPAELVAAAAAAGVGVLAVTDHDTVAGSPRPGRPGGVSGSRC